MVVVEEGNGAVDVGSSVIDQDGFLNIYFSILLVVHVSVLVGIAYFQRPWRLMACCWSPASKYRDTTSSTRSSSGYEDYHSGQSGNSFDMVSGRY
jgi:hypothetical protein